MLSYSAELVNDHNCVIWLGTGVVDDVEVDQFFYLDVIKLDAFDDTLEYRRDVFTDAHVDDNFF